MGGVTHTMMHKVDCLIILCYIMHNTLANNATASNPRSLCFSFPFAVPLTQRGHVCPFQGIWEAGAMDADSAGVAFNACEGLPHSFSEGCVFGTTSDASSSQSTHTTMCFGCAAAARTATAAGWGARIICCTAGSLQHGTSAGCRLTPITFAAAPS